MEIILHLFTLSLAVPPFPAVLTHVILTHNGNDNDKDNDNEPEVAVHCTESLGIHFFPDFPRQNQLLHSRCPNSVNK